MNVTLGQHLTECTADVLRAMMKRMGLPAAGLTRKDDLARAIERHLGEKLPDVLDTLTEAERLWLAESVHQDRFVGAAEFRAKFGAAWPWEARSGWSGSREHMALDAMVHRDWRMGEAGVVPALVPALKSALPKPAVSGIRTTAELPAEFGSGDDVQPLLVFEGERIALADLTRVLRLVRAGKIRVTDATRRPTDATSRLIGEALAPPDFNLEPPENATNRWRNLERSGPVRAHAWAVLVQQSGWAKSKGGTLNLTPTGQAMMQGFSPGAFRTGVSAFILNSDFDELHRVNHLRGQTGKAKRQISRPADRRDAIRDVMAGWPVGQWLEFAEACRTMDAAGASWDVMLETGILYLSEAQYGSIYDGEAVNRQFLRVLLMESFATLGLVDIAYQRPHGLWPELCDSWGGPDCHDFLGRYDGLQFVRMTALGAFALGFNSEYSVVASETPKAFRVVPNHDIVLLPAGHEAAIRATLGLLARPVSDQVWRLEAERMLEHVEGGGSFTELKQFLESHAADGLPENVQVFFNDLAAKLGACRRARKAVLIEWDDESTAHLIANSAGMRRLCHHAGENRLAVAQSDYRAFCRVLKKLGFVIPLQPEE